MVWDAGSTLIVGIAFYFAVHKALDVLIEREKLKQAHEQELKRIPVKVIHEHVGEVPTFLADAKDSNTDDYNILGYGGSNKRP